MKNQLKSQLKNKKGSALAYVLIFGMVIMVLVVGLLSVGKSGIAFTQESLESRQAYIDAKSVIEFGKVEISRRVEALGTAETKLNGLYEEYKLIKEEGTNTIEIKRLEDAISREVKHLLHDL